MNLEEKIAESYLKSLELGIVEFEPDGNIPPDFSINNQIGIEVRRLNQNFFEEDSSVGLEQLEIPIWEMFVDVLRSFDKSFKGESFWVGIDFQRPIEGTMKELKTKMKETLSSFLKERPDLPYEVQVNNKVSFYIMHSDPEEGELFREAGSSDMDAGGFIISIYIENINHFIMEKNLKINPVVSNYKEWWLLLVDTMSWGLSQDNLLEVIKHLNNLGSFKKLLIITREGELLAEI